MKLRLPRPFPYVCSLFFLAATLLYTEAFFFLPQFCAKPDVGASAPLIQLRSCCLDGASVLVVFEADTIMDKESGKRCIFILHFWLFPALYSPITDKKLTLRRMATRE